MTEHLSDEEIKGYRERDASPSHLLAFDRHVSHCEACRGRVRAANPSPSALRDLKANLHSAVAPEHLPYELLEAYVKNRADELDREIVESHTELCRPCATELNDLKAFAAMMNEAPATVGAKPQEASAWKQFLAAISLSGSWRFIGGLAVLFLVVSVSAVVILNSLRVSKSRNGSADEVAQSAPRQQPATPDRAASGNANATQPVVPPPTSAQQGQPEQKPSGVVALNLTRLTMGAGEMLTIPADAGFVDLRARVPAAGNYEARLEKVGGSSRNFSAQKSSANGFVVYRVPVSQLGAGSYALTLSKVPATDDETLSYRFIVRR